VEPGQGITEVVVRKPGQRGGRQDNNDEAQNDSDRDQNRLAGDDEEMILIEQLSLPAEKYLIKQDAKGQGQEPEQPFANQADRLFGKHHPKQEAYGQAKLDIEITAKQSQSGDQKHKADADEGVRGFGVFGLHWLPDFLGMTDVWIWEMVVLDSQFPGNDG